MLKGKVLDVALACVGFISPSTASSFVVHRGRQTAKVRLACPLLGVAVRVPARGRNAPSQFEGYIIGEIVHTDHPGAGP